MRHLRHYTSKARKSHFCNYCMHYIQPGEKYYADVYASDKIGIFVQKQHADRCPVDPWEEEAEMLASLKKTIEMKFEGSKELTEAA